MFRSAAREIQKNKTHPDTGTALPPLCDDAHRYPGKRGATSDVLTSWKMNIMHQCPSVEKDQPQTLPPDSMKTLLWEKMNFEAVLEKNLEEATQTMMRNISDMSINTGRSDYSSKSSLSYTHHTSHDRHPNALYRE